MRVLDLFVRGLSVCKMGVRLCVTTCSMRPIATDNLVSLSVYTSRSCSGWRLPGAKWLPIVLDGGPDAGEEREWSGGIFVYCIA